MNDGVNFLLVVVMELYVVVVVVVVVVGGVGGGGFFNDDDDDDDDDDTKLHTVPSCMMHLLKISLIGSCLYLTIAGNMVGKRNGGGGRDDIIFTFQKTRIPYNLTPIIGKISVFMSLF